MTMNKRPPSCFEDEGSDIILASCYRCVFMYDRCTRERDAYRPDSDRPSCAWYMTGVPLEIHKRKKNCKHYVQKDGTVTGKSS